MNNIMMVLLQIISLFKSLQVYLDLKEPVFHQVNLALLELLILVFNYAVLMECVTVFYCKKKDGREAQFAICFFFKQYCCLSCHHPLT